MDFETLPALQLVDEGYFPLVLVVALLRVARTMAGPASRVTRCMKCIVEIRRSCNGLQRQDLSTLQFAEIGGKLSFYKR